MFALVAGAYAGAVDSDVHAEVVRSESVVNPESYNYAYETSNGISGSAVGELKTVGKESVLVSKGDSSYISPEGISVKLSYVADENGTFSHL